MKHGDASPPAVLKEFFSILHGGANPHKHTDRTKRWAESSSQDAFFAIRKGLVKPKKHIALGMTLKSVTDSKQVVNIVHRFGHCLNYNALLEIETAIGSGFQDRQVASSDRAVPDLPFGVTFDNFDELTETLSGSDTLHDTMGILYQSVNESSENDPSMMPSPQTGVRKSRKRSLEVQEQNIPPYRSKPKLTLFPYSNTEVFKKIRRMQQWDDDGLLLDDVACVR